MAEGAVERSKPRGDLAPLAVSPSPGSALLHGRIEFHTARKAFNAIGSGDFLVETMNPGSGSRRPAASSGPRSSATAAAASSAVSGRRSDGGEFHHRALDPELSFEITFRRIGAGLANLGNTCFLNSVLQCLTYTEPFAAYLQSGKHKSSCRTAGFCAMCALQNHVMDALRSTGKILRPFHLVKNLRCISRNFRNSRQEDAHEYMVNLLESMHKCCLPSGIASESPSAYEKSLVHKIFGGRLRSQVKCLQCSYCSNKFDPFLDLSLEIVKAETLHKALSHFTAVEQLDGGEKQYHCQQCKQKVRAVKQLTIHKAPYVLTVHLKRFGSALPGQKINKKVDFEPTLDLKRYVSDPCEEDLKYTLYGVLVHAGFATHSGHYYCFVRTSSGMWYSLNDDEVFQVSEKTVLQQKAYMLFYVRNIRSPAPKRALDVACKENRLTSKDLPVYSLDSKKAISDRPRESGPKQYNVIAKTDTSSLGVSMPLKDISVEDHLLKKTSSLPCNLARETQKSAMPEAYIFHSSKIYSIKEPSPSVSPLPSSDTCSLFGKDSAKSAQLKDGPVFSVANKLSQSASARDNLIAENSLVENCSAEPAGARSGHMNEDHFATHVDQSNAHVTHHAKCNAISNSAAEKFLVETHDARNKEQINGTLCSTFKFREYRQATLSNHPSAVGSPEGLRINQVQYQDAIVNDGGSDDAVAPKVIGHASKEYRQNDLINNEQSTSYSSQKDAVGHAEFHKIVMKQKLPKHSRMRNMKFGSSRLFLAYLNLLQRNVKKKKHQRATKKRYSNTKGNQKVGIFVDNIHVDDETSRPVTVGVVDAGLVHSIKKTSCDSLQKENGITVDVDVVQSTKKKCFNCLERESGLCGVEVDILNTGSAVTNDSDHRKYLKNTAGTSSNLERLQGSTGAACIYSDYCVSRNLLMRGSGEVTVPRWVDINLPAEIARIIDDARNSTGYILDEWEKYDRGKKKVKRSRKLSGGRNHFQDIAAVRAQKKMKMGQTSSGNKPFRIHG